MTSLHERLIAAAYLVEPFEQPGVHITVSASSLREATSIHVMALEGRPDLVDAVLAECDEALPAEWSWQGQFNLPWRYQGDGFVGDVVFTVFCLTTLDDADAHVKEATA